MKIAVHIDEKYPNSFSKKWIEYIKATEGYEVVKVNLKSEDALKRISDCCGVMWHFRHTPLDKQAAPKILNAIEQNLNIPVWPNQNTRWHFDEKIAQHYLFQASDVPHIPSWVFWDYFEADRFLKRTEEYPLVFKLSVGAGAANVIKINNYSEIKQYLKRMYAGGIFPYTENEFSKYSMEGDRNYPRLWKRMWESAAYIMFKKIPTQPWYYQVQKNYLYVQKFIPDNTYDIRITVIGDRAFGFTRKNRYNDFRASGSGSIDYDKNKIPLEAVAIAHKVSKDNHFQSMAYDFMIEGDRPLINEISYGYMSKAVYECPGYWDEKLQWHEGHMWPQEAHVKDFIKFIEQRKN